MKKLLVCILAVMPLLFVSCKDNKKVEDPKDDASVQNPKEDVGWEMIVHVGDYIGWFSYSSSPVEIKDGSMSSHHTNVYISSVGAVNSLKDVDYIPTSGWVDCYHEIEIILGHGYVIKQQGNTNYNRVRFLEYIDKGAAKGYRIRADAWDPLMDE